LILAASAGVAATTFCGSGGDASTGAGDTTGGGGGGNVAAGPAFDLDLERSAASTRFTSATLDVRRVVVFQGGAPGAQTTGFACEAAGGSAQDTAETVPLDLGARGTTSVGKVRAAAGTVDEVWLLARARVEGNRRTHVAHGDLKCRAADGTLYAVLRLVPAAPIAISAAEGPRLVGRIDPQTALREVGSCDRACDEDDQHLENPDPVHGRILLASTFPLEAAGSASPDTPALAPPPAPPGAGGGGGGGGATGATVCAPGATCHCEDAASCDLSCPGGDCNLSCERAGTCRFSCAGGGCDVSCEDAGSCATSCSGNDCTMRCEGAGTCGISECASGCDLACVDSGSCR
jgi:hypothetical protein